MVLFKETVQRKHAKTKQKSNLNRNKKKQTNNNNLKLNNNQKKKNNNKTNSEIKGLKVIDNGLLKCAKS